MPCHGIASCGTPSGAVSWTNVMGSDAMSVAVLRGPPRPAPTRTRTGRTSPRRSRPGGSRGCRPARTTLPCGSSRSTCETKSIGCPLVRYVSSNPRRWSPTPVKSPLKNRPVRSCAVVVRLGVDPGLALHHHRPAGEAGALAVDDADHDQQERPVEEQAPDLAERALLGGERRPAVAVARHAEHAAAQHAARAVDRARGIRRHHALLVEPERVDLARLDRAAAGASAPARGVRGNRHATSETNSSVVISTNHHDPYTSKSPARP